jgi:hypothetical protein
VNLAEHAPRRHAPRARHRYRHRVRLDHRDHEDQIMNRYHGPSSIDCEREYGENISEWIARTSGKVVKLPRR